MPGEDSFVYKTSRPWPNKRLDSGSIVGHTTDTTVRLWFRGGCAGRVKLANNKSRPETFVALVIPLSSFLDENFRPRLKDTPFVLGDVPSGMKRETVEVPDWTRDSTFVVDLDGLTANTTYVYCLYYKAPKASESRIWVGREETLTFRTMPEPGSAVPISFGLYSCHQPFRSVGKDHDADGYEDTETVNMDMWRIFRDALRRNSGRRRHLAGFADTTEDDLRFVIGGGDQMYTDSAETLDIWKKLNGRMRRQAGRLYPVEEDMLSWYRDCYRGYWGFPNIQRVLANYPNYMIWDDHEIHDGWGSHELDKRKVIKKQFLNDVDRKKISTKDAQELIKRMGRAAFQAYDEYEHSHNPPTPMYDNTNPGEKGRPQFDYDFLVGNCAVYVLDGRGKRNLNADSHRILGKHQMRRFKRWLKNLDPDVVQFVFVVSAVPVFHIRSIFGKKALTKFLGPIKDDIRDAWEHDLHLDERAELLETLFDACKSGLRVSILSGDVHAAAAFRVEDGDGATIYQLTSSAITWNVPRWLGHIMKLSVPEEGTTDEGHRFERLAYFRDSNFAIIKTDPERDRLIFQLYGEQSSSEPEVVQSADYDEILESEEVNETLSNSIARIPLTFK